MGISEKIMLFYYKYFRTFVMHLLEQKQKYA
jgi:hypothetical protein